jgi:prepilin-type N-terminal cleavage/methylation domain-containing protein
MVAGREGRRGFSLLELVVVIAIITLIMALLLPAIQRVRATLDRLLCANHLRQLAIGLHNHHGDFNKLPPAGVSKPARYSWAVLILPYLEEDSTYHQFNLDRGWDDSFNQPAASRFIKVLMCPAAAGSGPRDLPFAGHLYGPCDYSPIFNVDPGLIATGLLDPWSGNPLGMLDFSEARFADVYDGLSNTILLAEVAGRPNWFRKRQFVGETSAPAGWATFNNLTPINLDGFSHDGGTQWGPCAINCTNIHEVYSFHPHGAHVVFGDGRVALLKENISIKVLAALVTRAGGEIVNISDLE